MIAWLLGLKDGGVVNTISSFWDRLEEQEQEGDPCSAKVQEVWVEAMTLYDNIVDSLATKHGVTGTGIGNRLYTLNKNFFIRGALWNKLQNHTQARNLKMHEVSR